MPHGHSIGGAISGGKLLLHVISPVLSCRRSAFTIFNKGIKSPQKIYLKRNTGFEHLTVLLLKVIQGLEYQNCPVSTFSSGDKVVKTLGSCGTSWEKTSSVWTTLASLVKEYNWFGLYAKYPIG